MPPPDLTKRSTTDTAVEASEPTNEPIYCYVEHDRQPQGSGDVEDPPDPYYSTCNDDPQNAGAQKMKQKILVSTRSFNILESYPAVHLSRTSAAPVFTSFFPCYSSIMTLDYRSSKLLNYGGSPGGGVE